MAIDKILLKCHSLYRVKKILISVLFFILTLFLFIVSPSSVNALENPSSYYDWNVYATNKDVLGLSTDSDYKNFQQHNYFFDFIKDTAPGNPLYLLKKVEEGLTLTFTFNNEEKEKARLEFAGERLAEMQEVASEGNISALNSLSRSYENIMKSISQNLENLNNKGQDVKALADEVDQEASRHNLVLEEVALVAPEAANDGIDRAISASELAVDTVADVEDRPAVPESVVNRLKATEALGILTPEEVNKVIDSDTRREARDELRKYVSADLFPESDFKKFDETSLEEYPQGYYMIQEIKKFKELKELETKKPNDSIVEKLQEFARTYKAGETIPGDLRQWWVPSVRLEELQNTIRPDLINQDFLRNRPDYLQKYQEVVERIKPTREDAQYVNNLINKNPDLLNDPSYARLKALSDKFGSTEERRNYPQVQACGTGYHWAPVPFMPNGGYCVPNYQFTATDSNFKENPCPSGYHRPFPGAACYSDNPEAANSRGGLSSSGNCPSGYGWVPESNNSRGGYCAPRSVSDGGFPSPVYTVGYCLPGQAFRDGKCETYSPPPTEGCASGSWWNGTSCIQQKSCGQGFYQDSSGECKQSSSGGGNNTGNACPMPSAGCGNSSWWDYGTCSCRSTTINYSGSSGSSGTNNCNKPPSCEPGYYVDNTCTCKPYPINTGSGTYSGIPSRESQEAACRAGGGSCQGWYNGACSCIHSNSTNYTNYTNTTSSTNRGGSCPSGSNWVSEQSNPNGGYCVEGSNTGSTSSGPSTGCGSGYYWNGNSCTSNPSGSVQPGIQPTQTVPTESQPQPQVQPQPESQPVQQESAPVPQPIP